MKKFNEYIKESLTFEENQLYWKISKLGPWLYNSYTDNDGTKQLGLRWVIDDILKPHMTPLSPKEKQESILGLSVLLNAGFIDQKTYDTHIIKIRDKMMIKENGVWSIMNKLNTNNIAISYLIVYLIHQLEKDDNDDRNRYAEYIKDKINENPKEGLRELKLKLKDIINIYFPNLSTDFSELKRVIVTPIIHETTELGEGYEDTVELFFIKSQFDIKFKGGNGNYIDMVFGCDLIVYHKKYGYKRVQVKSPSFNKEDEKLRRGYIEKGVEWLAMTEGGKVYIYDMNTLELINKRKNS